MSWNQRGAAIPLTVKPALRMEERDDSRALQDEPGQISGVLNRAGVSLAAIHGNG
jgi:hypothetical protein